MKKLFDKEAAKRFWNNIKKLFVRKPQNEGAVGKYLKYVSEDSTEWADFPAFLNYKGTVPNEASLKDKTADAVKGDVYTVLDSNAEFFYNGTNWEYIGDVIGGSVSGDFVKKTGDTMTGPLTVNFTNTEKGTENKVSIQGNSIDVYHDGNTASAAKIKRDQFTLADSDGNIIFKVKMTGGKDIWIGKGANKNQLAVGTSLTINNQESGAFAFGTANIIETNGEHSGVFGGSNTVKAKNSLCGGDGNILEDSNSGNGDQLVMGTHNTVDSSYGAVFGANNHVKELDVTERTYNGNEYGLLVDGSTICDAQHSLVTGSQNKVHGDNTLVSGSLNLVIGRNSHAEGYSNKVYGASAHVEGDSNIAVNNNTHAEGDTTQAVGEGSHSEGRDTIAFGEFSHAQGDESKSTGNGSFASGFGSEAVGNYSSALGMHAKTPDLQGSLACGMYNSTAHDPYFSVGNGWADDGRQNLFEVGTNAGTIINTNTKITGTADITGITNIPQLRDLHKVISLATGTSVQDGFYYRYKLTTNNINITLDTPNSDIYSKTVFFFKNGVGKDLTGHVYFKLDGNNIADIKIIGPTTAAGLAKSKKVIVENILGQYIITEEEYIIPQQFSGGGVTA